MPYRVHYANEVAVEVAVDLLSTLHASCICI